MATGLRKSVYDVKAFNYWAATAPAGDYVIYHMGNLGLDRANNRTLHELAETVLLLQETGFVVGAKENMNLAGFTGWGYVAHRSGRGWAPQSVMRGDITASQYKALCAIRDGNAYQSSVRVVRDALSIPDGLAADILAYLFAHEWIERDEPKGWKLSPAGIALLT